MFVRAIYDLYEWEKEKIEDIETNLLKSWIDDDPEYSIYKIENKEDIETIKSIVLRLVIENPKKWKFGFQLLILKEELLKNLPEIKPDESYRYKCLHANIINATYDTFKKCVLYTFSNCVNDSLVIDCDFYFIANLFGNLSDEDYTWYLNQKEDKEKIKQTNGDIKKYFWKDKDPTKFPKYISV